VTHDPTHEVFVAFGLLLIVGLMMALQVFVARRAWSYKEDIHDLAPDPNAMRLALEDWLQQPRIVKAMLDTGTASREELQATLLTVPAMSEVQLRSTCKSLLRVRAVRAVIAVYVIKTQHIPEYSHKHLVRSLTAWADPVPTVRHDERTA
jgi:hypothetical protein